MNKGILTVTVNPAVDVTVTPLCADKLRMRCSTNCVLSAGGKGVNVARALRTLGERALAAGIAGGETGEFLQGLLRREKIPAAFARIKGTTRSNVTVLGPPPARPAKGGPRSGRRGRVLGEGPRLTPGEIRRFEDRYRRWLRHSHFVVLCGRNAVGAPVNWYARLVRLARHEGVPAALDTSGAALAAGLKAKPFLIKPNLEEAEAILRRRLDSPAKIKKALGYFHSRGIRVVLLSLGARGAVASDGKNICHARPPRVRAVRSDVGCGDALLAGFVQAYRAGQKSLPEALRQAVACGTANALNSTPGLIRPADVFRLRKRTVVKIY